MAPGRKRKIGNDLSMLERDYTDSYFFIEVCGKPVCLICGKQEINKRKLNMQRHYDVWHPNMRELIGEERQNKIEALKHSLQVKESNSQKINFSSYDVTQASYEISELIAKKLKTPLDGEFVKECLLTTAKFLMPHSTEFFEEINLSPDIVSSRIIQMGRNIENKLKEKANSFVYFSLAIEKTTDVTNLSQLAVFIRGVTSDFIVKEELLMLEPIIKVTRNENVLTKLLAAMKKFNLQLEKLSGIATDGSPPMVDPQKGLLGLVKKEMLCRGVFPSDLNITHNIFIQDTLCAKFTQLRKTMPIVKGCISCIKNKGICCILFKKLLEGIPEDQRDLIYFRNSRWLKRNDMLNRFYAFRNEISEFMTLHGNPIPELHEKQWLCDLAFIVDMSKHLSDFHAQFQEPNQLVSSMLSKVESFHKKMHLWKGQLQEKNLTHFPSLQEQMPLSTGEYASECANFSEWFDGKVKEMKSKQIEFDVFATPFNVTAASIPSIFQHEIIQLQTDNTLKVMYYNLPLIEFYKRHISADEFPVLRKHALKIVSLFGNISCCEKFFAKMNLTKSRIRSKVTDETVEMQLRVATSSFSPNIARLSMDNF